MIEHQTPKSNLVCFIAVLHPGHCLVQHAKDDVSFTETCYFLLG